MKKHYIKYVIIAFLIVVGSILALFNFDSASPAEAYLKDPINDTVAGKLYGEVVQELATIRVSEKDLIWIAVVGGERYSSGAISHFESIVCYHMKQNNDKYRLGDISLQFDLDALSNPGGKLSENMSQHFDSLPLSGGKTIYLQILPASFVTNREDRYTYVEMNISTEKHSIEAVLGYYID